MRIGIIGSGMVGQALAQGFAGKGHDVILGTRDPGAEKVRTWLASAGPGVRLGTFEEAAKHAEVALVATLWEGTENALRLAGPKNLEGKVVVDVTNPLDFSGGMPKLAIGHTDSGGEQVARWLPGARVVKALNQVTASTMISPKREEGVPDMFVAGEDADAKALVTRLLVDFGWGVIDLGGLAMARYLEPLAMIWITHYIRTKSGSHAFKLLAR